MNTARLVAVTALVTLGLIAVGSAATADGGDPPTTPPAPSATTDPGRPTPAPAPGGPGAPDPAGRIGYDQASRIALDRTGGGRVTDAEWDVEHGRGVWEIEVLHGRTEHDLRLDDQSGHVLRHEQDYADDHDDYDNY